MKPSRGILNPRAGEKKYNLARYPASEDLGYFIERYWIVEWDLPEEEAYTQKILTHPCINMVIEREKSFIYGIEQNSSSQHLQGKGSVFGIKFKPGGFYPFLKAPVSRITGKKIPIPAIFTSFSRQLEEEVLNMQDHGDRVERMEKFLRDHIPEPDPTAARISAIVDRIWDDRHLTKVDDLVLEFGISKRTLQRLFQQYVGVSPKWVIRRYRLHEAAEQLTEGTRINWLDLALKLGYYDQAHFINDFKTIVGRSPEEYAKQAGLPYDWSPLHTRS